MAGVVLRAGVAEEVHYLFKRRPEKQSRCHIFSHTDERRAYAVCGFSSSIISLTVSRTRPKHLKLCGHCKKIES
jgi:hypothetical protein